MRLLPTLFLSFSSLAAAPLFATELMLLPLGSTFSVNSLEDVADENPGDGVCKAVNLTVCTLRAAIMEANALHAADEVQRRYVINVAVAGEFELLSSDLVDDDGEGTDTNGDLSGDLDIRSNIYLKGLVETDSDGGSVMVNQISAALLGRAIEIHQSPGWRYKVRFEKLTVLGRGSSEGNAILNNADLQLDNVTVRSTSSTKTSLYHLGGRLQVNGSVFDQGARAIRVQAGEVYVADGTAFSNLDMRAALGGAGIRLEQGFLSINGASFEGNQSRDLGGAIQLVDGTAIVRDTTFSDNSSTNGGAIYSDGTLLVRDGVTFAENSADELGGALYINSGFAEVADSVIASNTAYHCGGGVYVSGNGRATFSRVDLNSNAVAVNLAGTYTDVAGGGVCLDNRTALNPVLIQDSSFRANSASANAAKSEVSKGGAIYHGGHVEVQRSTFYANTAQRGAAIYSNGAAAQVVNASFYRNQASDTAGAIYHADDSQLTVLQSSFWNNRGGEGNTVHLEAGAGSIALAGTLLQGNGDDDGDNVADEFGDVYCTGAVTSLGGNLAGDSSCSLTMASDQQSVSLSHLALVSTDDVTNAVELAADDTAALNAVPAALCQPFDLRGLKRADSGCDVGAWEVGASAYVRPLAGFDMPLYKAPEMDGSWTVAVQLERNAYSGAAVTGEVFVVDLGSATEAVDYQPQDSRILSWAGTVDDSQAFAVTLNDDFVRETETDESERFGLVLANLTGLAATMDYDYTEFNIKDDDSGALASGEFRLDSDNFSALEKTVDATADTAANGEEASDDGEVDIRILRSNGSEGAVTLYYYTENITATAGKDYVALDGEVTFEEGETVKTITVNFNDDAKVEEDETFRFVIEAETSNEDYTAFSSPRAAIITIVDDDTAPTELTIESGTDRAEMLKRTASGAMDGIGLLAGAVLLGWRRRRSH